MTISRMHVLVRGRVQGVGFRYAAFRQAQVLGVTGWVRNCPDGRVEGEFQGTMEVVAAMLAWCRQGPPMAHVEELQSVEVPLAQDSPGFEIR